MRRCLVVSCVLCLMCGVPSGNAQTDTTLREFYPLGLGDLWQYRDESGTRYPNKQVVDVDTLLSNGANYVVIGSPAPPFVFDRIDSGLRVQWYAPWATGDTCGGSFAQEASVYRLGENSGSVWKDCYNWNGFLGRPLIRYGGTHIEFVFGQMHEVMVFQHGYVNPETGDTVWATEDKLARGIGLIWREIWWRLGYEYLSGAIISSDTLGVIVSVREGSRDIPTMFTLYQNYPNPFNPATTIQYDLPERSHVRLTVHDVLGREVVTLVDQVQNAGRHEVGFDGGNHASGIYLCRLLAGAHTFARKMILQK